MNKYDGFEVYDHPDDGLCWTWKDHDGQNCICQLTTTEKAMYADVLSIRAELTRAHETIEIVASQRDRALEAVEKLRAAVKLYNAFIPGEWPMPFGYGAIQGRLNEALAATEPATVELPKCDHCGSPCGIGCDGSSNYTPDGKQSTPRVGYMGDINGAGCDPDTP